MNVSSLGNYTSNSLINGLMTLARRPITQLESQKSGIEVVDAIYSDIDTKLTALRDQAVALADTISSPFEACSVASCDSDVLTATATADAAGSHDIHVHQLARHHTLLSDKLTGTGTDVITAEGAGTKTFNVTVNGETTLVEVEIEAGDDNETILSAVAATINEAMASVDDSVTATALQVDATDYRLTVRSDETGLTCKVTLEDVSGTLLDTLGIDDESVASTTTTGGYVYSDSELVADLTVDGVRVTRDSNTIDDVIEGVTLTLWGVQEADSNDITLSVSPDAASIRSEVEELLTAYNDALSYLKAKTSVDADTGVRGPLAGKFTFSNLILQLRSLMTEAVSTITAGSLQSLADLGIEAAADGSLSITDTDEFDEAVQAHPDNVAELFNSTDGVAAQLADMLKPFVKTGGYVDINQDGIDRKITAIDNRIDRLEERVAKREEQLIAQYSSVQSMMATFSAQQSFLSNIYSMYGFQ